MLLRTRTPFDMIRAGLVCLIAANLLRWLVRSRGDFASGFVDGLMGVAFGLAIGLLLLGTWKQKKNTAC